MRATTICITGLVVFGLALLGVLVMADRENRYSERVKVERARACAQAESYQVALCLLENR